MPRHRSVESKAPPRLMIEVTEEQFNTFRERLPYGFQRQVFGAIVEDMIKMWEEFGDDFTRAMLSKQITYRQFVRDYQEQVYGHSGRSEGSTFPRNDLGSPDGIYQGDQGIKEDQDRN